MFALSCSLVAPAIAPAFADDIGGDVYITAAPGEAVGSVDVFYDQLSPYGVWVDDADLGRVFIPDQDAFVPYRNGHWQYTDAGFVWVSAEPFGWATSHYGRWGFSPAYSRWVWQPDTTWGPAWVQWSQADGDFGWAPLQPDAYVGFGIEQPVDAWRFCPADHVLDENIVRYYEPRERVEVIRTRAQPLNHRVAIGGAQLHVGPSAAMLREHHVTAKRVKLDQKISGRMTATEAKTAVEHARTNKAEVEKKNTARLETKSNLRDVETKVKAKSPETHAKARPTETKRPEQTQTKKPETKTETKTETRPQTKTETKSETKTKTTPKAETRTERTTPKAETKAKTEAKPETKTETKQDRDEGEARDAHREHAHREAARGAPRDEGRDDAEGTRRRRPSRTRSASRRPTTRRSRSRATVSVASAPVRFGVELEPAQQPVHLRARGASARATAARLPRCSRNSDDQLLAPRRLEVRGRRRQRRPICSTSSGPSRPSRVTATAAAIAWSSSRMLSGQRWRHSAHAAAGDRPSARSGACRASAVATSVPRSSSRSRSGGSATRSPASCA